MRRTLHRLQLSGAGWADKVFWATTSEKVVPSEKDNTHHMKQLPQKDTSKVTQAAPFAQEEQEVTPSEIDVYQKRASKVSKMGKASVSLENEMVLPKEEILAHEAAIIRQTYEGVDVRSPATLPANHLLPGRIPQKALSWRDQVLAVSDFVSGHLAHHVMLEDWAVLFDLKSLDVEIRYFLWVIHLHMISRRSLAIPIEKWARRREVLQEMQVSMRTSWEESCTQILGRPPLDKQKEYLKDMYLVVAMNFEEALSGTALNATLSDSREIVASNGPTDEASGGNDLAIFSFLFRFIPFQRAEDTPMYSYYRLVHYIRFHLALLDRIPDEEFMKGNFNFINPLSEAVCEYYQDIPMS